MAEIVISIGAKVAEYVVAPIAQGATYLFCVKRFIGNVEKEKQDLEVKLADVEKRKEEAERNTEEIMPSVKKWLEDVDAVLEEVQKLQQELEGGGIKCFNVSRRYSLAKQMEDKAKQMMELKQNSNLLEPFSQLIQLPNTFNVSSKGFMDFNSRKSAYDRLLEAMRDGKNKMVGLCGMGGSGKTTLALKLAHRVTELKLFDNFVMAVVSKPPNAVKIQQEIAEQIGLELKEQLPSKRAERLSLGLKNKRILIILDDLWRELSLEEIGIPLNEGCCVLLTTRLRDVCVSMDCEGIIELPLLAEEEAWDLFKIRANMTNVSSNMNEFDSIGRKIVDECKGLPVAIVTVGSALKGKSIQVWRSTLRRLQHPPHLDNIEEDLKAPYAILQISYDNLPSPLAKSLFLLCSMFPEDHEIHMEDLIRFGKGTLNFNDNNIYMMEMEDARNEILATIQKLLDSCLLMHTNEQSRVKMHDLVRDVALWIAKKQRQAILTDNHVVSNMVVSLEDAKAVSLWNLDENFRLSNEFSCPTLEILLLQPHGSIEDLGAMGALKVLALITNGFGWGIRRSSIFCSIQSSIVSLKNLQSLCLRGKKLGDVSFLNEIKGLEILDLRGSQFDELPTGIVDMKKLKLLDIFGCEIMESPLEVIERCDQLEEIYIRDRKSISPKTFFHSRLKRYAIYDSRCEALPFLKYFNSCDEALRALCIQDFKVYDLNSSMKDLILRANYLWLENCKWDHRYINVDGIKHLGVSYCHEKRFLIDNLDVSILQTQQVFSHLITLTLFKMERLEQVFQDSSISISLPLLQKLTIESCPELRPCIFTHATITSLPKLRKLKIYYCEKVQWLFSYSLASCCPSLEEIIVTDCSQFERLIDKEAADGDELLHHMQDHPYGDEIDRAHMGVTAKGLNQLHSKNLSSSSSLSSYNVCFPKLKKIEIFECNKVRRLLSYSLASHCPSLEEISIGNCSEVESVVDGDSDEEAAHAHGNQLPLLKLQYLNLYELPKLKEIFGFEYKLKESSRQKDENGKVRVDLELHELLLNDLPELKYIWKGTSQMMSLYKLEQVILVGCPKLENIFTLANIASLPELKTLTLQTCKEWEGIFCEESLKNLSSPSSLSSSNVCFPKLKKIEISKCNKVRRLLSYSLASHCPSLEYIDIWDCSEVESVVDEEAAHAHENQLPLLKLQYLNLYELPKLKEIFGFEYKLKESPPHKEENGKVRVNLELQELYLMFLPELEYIWKCPTQIMSLHKLERVTLWDCPKLKTIFTLTIVTSFPELKKLEVKRCEEWEGIFCEESLKNLSSSSSSSSSSSTVCFPRLESIDIYGCNKVRRLFSYSLASHCPSLNNISIKDCSQLEGVVQAYEGEVVDHNEKLFPMLNHLNLRRLPQLREIYPNYEFNLLYGTMIIQGCPNICNIIPLEYKAASSET